MRRVHSIGPTNQPLLALVGEAPGREEERRGQPFVGQSGFLLDQMLAVAGITRSDCYITNVSDIRPPGNDFSVFYRDAKRTDPTNELYKHRERLREELLRIQPKVTVAFGNEALKATAALSGIAAYRGVMIERQRNDKILRRILPTYHPAYVMRVYNERPVVELDLKKAYRQARNPYTPQMQFQIDPSLDQILDWFNKRHSPVAVDIETIGPCTRCIGFGWSSTEAISIPLIWRGKHRWMPEEEKLILQCLNAQLSDPTIKKYLQYSPFDCTMIGREFGFYIDGIELDTMYAFHLLYPGLGGVAKRKGGNVVEEIQGRKGLKFISSLYTDFPMYWGKERFETDENNAEYNCYDCCATWIAAQAMEDELVERNLGVFYHQKVHPTIFALTRVQNRGILMDIEQREVVRAETEAKLEEATKRLGETVGFELNPNSPKQVKELVYGTWKLPPQYKPKSKSVTTDDDALRILSRKFPSYTKPLKDILLCRQTRKLISTYIDTELINNRVHTSFGLAVTGRITSGKTWDGLGGNLQNIPRGEFRRLYRADPGKILIKADLKQAEYMVFVWDAPVPTLIHEYVHNPDFDVHRFNASEVYAIPQDQVTKKQRDHAKNGVYAGNYKVGALKISRMYDMTFKEAKFLLERYKRVRPELELWWAKIEDMIKTTRIVSSLRGRDRIFFGRCDDNMFRAAYSSRCQSTVADIINEALVILDEQDIEILLQVHDELIVQCPENQVDETVPKVKKAMEIPINVPGVEIPLVIPTEISVGPNWYDTKEYRDTRT